MDPQQPTQLVQFLAPFLPKGLKLPGRRTLREKLSSNIMASGLADENLPYIFLLFGDGGMGKTTLARRFRDIAQLEQSFEAEFQMLWVDWEDEQ